MEIQEGYLNITFKEVPLLPAYRPHPAGARMSVSSSISQKGCEKVIFPFCHIRSECLNTGIPANMEQKGSRLFRSPFFYYSQVSQVSLSSGDDARLMADSREDTPHSALLIA